MIGSADIVGRWSWDDIAQRGWQLASLAVPWSTLHDDPIRARLGDRNEVEIAGSVTIHAYVGPGQWTLAFWLPWDCRPGIDVIGSEVKVQAHGGCLVNLPKGEGSDITFDFSKFRHYVS